MKTRTIVSRNMNDLIWLLATNAVDRDGFEEAESGDRAPWVASRGPVVIEFVDPRPASMICTLPERKLDPWVTACEFPWLLAGRNDIAWLRRFLPRAEAFSDNGTTWPGGYGPRLAKAWPRVVEELARNPRSRRAALPLLLPEDVVRVRDTRDFPCTTGLHFLVRNGALDLHVTMRSNDVFWGLSGVNAYNWASLLALTAGVLGLRVGTYFHFAHDLHIYDRHRDAVEKIAAGPPPGPPPTPTVDAPVYDYVGRPGAAIADAKEAVAYVEAFRGDHPPEAYEMPVARYFRPWARLMLLKRAGGDREEVVRGLASVHGSLPAFAELAIAREAAR